MIAAPFTNIPIVDLAQWYAARTDAERRAFARRVDEVWMTTGFMYLVGHRIATSLRARVFEQGRAFFALSPQRKAQIDFRHANRYKGYVPLQAESSDPLATPDLKEAFDFGLTIPDIAASGSIAARLRVPNQWPADLPDFRPTLEAYFTEVRRLAETLFGVISVALSLPRDFFAAKIDRPIAQMRVLHYPAQPAAGGYGIGAHCDYECFTILAQDDVGGLQVQNEAGTWINAPPLHDAFVINIGEMLERWTNDRYRATPHRVINPAGRERFSIPFFFATNFDAIVEPIVVPGSAQAVRYAPIAAGDYLAARLDEIYGSPPGTA